MDIDTMTVSVTTDVSRLIEQLSDDSFLLGLSGKIPPAAEPGMTRDEFAKLLCFEEVPAEVGGRTIDTAEGATGCHEFAPAVKIRVFLDERIGK